MQLTVKKVGQPTSNNNIIVTLVSLVKTKNPFGVDKNVTRSFCYAMPSEGASEVSEGLEVKFDMTKFDVVERSNPTIDDAGNAITLTSFWLHEKVNID